MPTQKYIKNATNTTVNQYTQLFPFFLSLELVLNINRKSWVEPEPIGAFNELFLVDQEVLYK
jgi:hypothetical protein